MQLLQIFVKYREKCVTHMVVNELACWCLSTLCTIGENAAAASHAGAAKLVRVQYSHYQITFRTIFWMQTRKKNSHQSDLIVLVNFVNLN